jgi:cellulose synthase/poly-beta-1,6-N-acetylglucosamine synthase-like glycosyltransferase
MDAAVGFWLCLGSVTYIYFGYPLIALLISRISWSRIAKAHIEPSVTVLISAFNEEKEIERTITNKLSQDYPPDRLNVIVVSDGSTDRTDEIISNLARSTSERLQLIRQEPRLGKTQALNVAATNASTDILVFADANSIYAPNAVRALVRSFADPTVGYVTGQMRYTYPDENGIGQGSGKYMQYENLLRAVETRLGSIVGVDGGIDAVRRELYVPMSADQLPDFVLPLNVVEQGRRVVYEEDAILYEPALSTSAEEFRMRVRVSLRAFWALYDKRGLLNPLRYPLFAWQLLSHKVLRYVAFAPITGLFMFNALSIAENDLYAVFFALQLLFYTFAALGPFLGQLPVNLSAVRMPYYFLIVNAACALALWKFLKGEKIVLWKPREGA